MTFARRSCAVLALALALQPNVAVTQPVSPKPTIDIVSTIAQSAPRSLIEPFGIAAGNDQTIYVADALGNAIRQISAGNVSTLIGPRADSPTVEAVLNYPSGVAIGPDNAIYVSDTGNRKVLRLANHVLTTIAKDLSAPRSLSVDADGNVYVADFGVGIRKITPAGDVSTFWSDDKNVYGVSVSGRAASLTYAIACSTGIAYGSPERVLFAHTTDLRQPTGQQQPLGRAYGIALAGQDAVVITDPYRSAVRYVSLYERGFPIVRSLVGDRSTSDAGGYKDGNQDTALVDEPLGVARLGDGSFVIADSGNRRVRKISELNLKRCLDTERLAPMPFQKNAYHIAMVGNSFVSLNTLWVESIPGTLEGDLAHVAPSLHPDVRCAKLSGTGFGAERDYIANYLADGDADLVVLLYDNIAHGYDLQARPELAIDELWKKELPKEIADLRTLLAKNRTKLLVVYVPDGTSVSDMERVERSIDLNGGPTGEYLADGNAEAETEKIYTSLSPSLPLLQPMIAQEKSDDHVRLFYPGDEHPSRAGAKWIGEQIAAYVANWKPWQRP